MSARQPQDVGSAHYEREPKRTMAQVVPKKAEDPGNGRRVSVEFDSARSAIAGFFRANGLIPGDTVLCPAYVGVSAREGSGVLDPLLELGLQVRFYRVDAELGIDVGHLRELLATGDVAGVIVIPFFGHIPRGYREAIDSGQKSGALVLEDEAHALLTDLIKGTSGRFGDAAVVSLHKFLPVERGGAILLNQRQRSISVDTWQRGNPVLDLLEYDLASIARQRIVNANALSELLVPLAGLVDPLWAENSASEVLHSFPVVISSGSRDLLYERMNDDGYGVVSLYHTLVPAISLEEFPDSHALSRRILNLPIHQDVRTEDLQPMVDRLRIHARLLAS